MRKSVESWTRGVGDFDSLPSLFHEDMELRESAPWPEPGVYKGLHAFVGYWRQFAERFEISLGTVDEIFDGGDRVLFYLRCVGQDRHDGGTLDMSFAVIYTFRGDKIALVEPFLDRGAAHAAWQAPADQA
jgi:ketosteroid isomerase-like protein